MMKSKLTIALVMFGVLLALSAAGQGTTGVLRGTVTADDAALPGVTVTITSPSLQGVRTTVTDANGIYNFPSIPPGKYKVEFELEGMATQTRDTTVSLAQSSRVDAVMAVPSVSEMITVTAAAPSALETTEISTNFTAETIDSLPIERSITGVTELSPGVGEFGASNQVMISGAPSYENLYLVNGAVVNDALRGQPESVYIEDAVAETTVMTANVSAEYGRFTGGVISAITKSGGNEFSGSLRDSLSNDDWKSNTPYEGEAEHIDKVNEVWEATIGGRILRDRLWFFGAGRTASTSSANTTVITNIPYTTEVDEDRWEIKLTGQLTPKHSLVGSYLDRLTLEKGRGFGAFTDLQSLDDRELPNTLMTFSYQGVLTSSLLVQAQYSNREYAFVGSGSNFTDLIYGTMAFDLSSSPNRRAWSPTFCGVCPNGDPQVKARDNEYTQLKGSYFLTTALTGTHNLVAGLEDFSEFRNEDNYQSGSSWRIYGDFRYVGDQTYIRLNPSRRARMRFLPILQLSTGSETRMQSVYLNDKWDLNSNWSFNVGVRYDKADAVDQGGNPTADDSAYSPRLAATWDIKGDGRHRITAGFNQYAASLDVGINDEGGGAAAPSSFYWWYRGPEINGPSVPDNELLTTDVVFQQAFEWFFNENCPGLTGVDVIKCTKNLRSASVPGIDTKIAPGGLKSPKMQEYSIGYGAQIGSKGFVRADYIKRDWSDFYTSTTSLENGKVTDPVTGNEYDLTLISNDDTGLVREYDGLQVQGSYRILDRLSMGGNYTWSELRGNAQTESTASATDSIQSQSSYSEYLQYSWNRVVRALPGDVTHRLNLWFAYDLPTPVGNLNFSLLERYQSGNPYYANGTIDIEMIENPGYLDPPDEATFYFEGSKDYRTEDVTRTDLAINYELPLGKVQLFVQADILNLFNESAIVSVDQTILTSLNSSCRKADGTRCDAFNPREETPVEGVHWKKGSTFGQPDDESSYQMPRVYRFSLGVRF